MSQSGRHQDDSSARSGPPSGSVDYFDHLRRRSKLAWLYRSYWLYPKLCRHLHGRVLDIGCGIGDLLSYRKGTVGTDINPRAVEWCRRLGHAVEPMAPDVLPFDSGAFDGVVLDNVIEHIVNPLPLLAEARRVLKPGGLALVGVPGRRGYASDPDHKVFHDEGALTSLMRSGGFARDWVVAMPFRSTWLDKHMRQYCLYGLFHVD